MADAALKAVAAAAGGSGATAALGSLNVAGLDVGSLIGGLTGQATTSKCKADDPKIKEC